MYLFCISKLFPKTTVSGTYAQHNYTKEIKHTSNLTNNITRHNHNNDEHNVIKNMNKHIEHINNYDAEINYHSKKPLNKKQYYNFYNDNFNFRKIENISLTQQTDITNTITENITQTNNYVDNNYLNNKKKSRLSLLIQPQALLKTIYGFLKRLIM